MPKPGSFYHPVDTWSSDLEGARMHAEYHAVDDSNPYDGYCPGDDDPENCEVCAEELVLENFVEEETGRIYFECANCGAEHEGEDADGPS